MARRGRVEATLGATSGAWGNSTLSGRAAPGGGPARTCGSIDLRPDSAGLHLVGYLPTGEDDAAMSRAAYARGVDAAALSATYLRPPRARGLLLGYAAYSEPEIRSGMFALIAYLDATP